LIFSVIGIVISDVVGYYGDFFWSIFDYQ